MSATVNQNFLRILLGASCAAVFTAGWFAVPPLVVVAALMAWDAHHAFQTTKLLSESTAATLWRQVQAALEAHDRDTASVKKLVDEHTEKLTFLTNRVGTR